MGDGLNTGMFYYIFSKGKTVQRDKNVVIYRQVLTDKHKVLLDSSTQAYGLIKIIDSCHIHQTNKIFMKQQY